MTKSIKLPVFMAILSTFTFPLSTISYGDTHAAANCSQAAVQAAMDAASEGDTVTVPAGTATWTGTATLGQQLTWTFPSTYASKSLTIVGAGVDNTVIHASNSQIFSLCLVEGKPFRLTGFTFYGPTSIYGNLVGVWGGLNKNFRVDHCKFVNAVTSRALCIMNSYGLVDHCDFIETGSHSSAGISYYANWDGNDNGNLQWEKPLTLGTSNAVYIEDCNFNFPYSVGDGGVDMYAGAKYVVRHNNFINVGEIGHHGLDSGYMRSACSWEVYENTFTFTGTGDGTATWWTVFHSRGGTGVFFNNYISGSYGTLLMLSNYRSVLSLNYNWGHCDGSNPLDGNMALEAGTHTGGNGAATLACAGKNWIANQWVSDYYVWNLTTGSKGQVTANTANTVTATLSGGTRNTWNAGDSFKLANGYPCLDQNGYANLIPGTTGQPQRSEPIYQWNNDFKGGTGTIVINAQGYTAPLSQMKLNRDYYNDVARPGYVPYAYPHPLQGGTPPVDTTPPSAPSAVRDGTGADIASTFLTTQLSANWDAATDAESTISKYYYAIGTTAGATNAVNWTDNGAGLSVARTGLTLAVGTTYYFSVKAQNSAGLQGPARNSNGQVVLQSQDTTPPANIAMVNDGTGSDVDSTALTTQLSANWTASTDAQSGISGYKYAIGTLAGGTNIVAWTLLGNVLAVTKTGLSLTAGTTYYFSVKVVNGAGMESLSPKNSDGICVLAQGVPGPVVTGVDVTNLTDRSATIIWNTDIDAKGQVQYGTTLNYIDGGEDSSPAQRHMIDIKSLAPDTMYHYRVVNTDGNNTVTRSDDYTFKTYALITRPTPIVGRVYPNPYKLTDTSQMTFALSSATGGDIKIYTLSGKLVKNIPVVSGTTDALWNLTNEGGNKINGGLYVYIMSDSDGNKKTGKIVITN